MSPRLSIFLVALVMAVELAAAAPESFEAVYTVSRNGKALGEMHSRLHRTADGTLVYRSVTEGRKGLAGVLGVRIEEESQLDVAGDGLRSRAYRYRQEMVARKRERNWRLAADGRVTETDNHRQWHYTAYGAVLDRHSVVLGIATRLRQGVREGAVFELPVADKGKVAQWRFLVSGRERIDTGKGSIEAIRIERVRKDSERKTVSWHAPEMDFLPVKVEQVEPDGEVLLSVLQRYQRR
jgi:hypothetical protein